MPSNRDESTVVRTGRIRPDYASGDDPSAERAGRARVIAEQAAAEAKAAKPVAAKPVAAPVAAAPDRRDRGEPEAPAAAPVAPAAPTAPAYTPGVSSAYTAASAADAGTQRELFDDYAKAGMGASPAESMKLAQAAAQQTAQAQADAAIRQGVKGAKTAGAMGGQAALAGSAQGAGAYSQGLESGRQQYFDTTKLGATLGSEMSSRLARAGQTEAGLEQGRLAAETSRYAADKSAKAAKPSGLDTFGKVLGTVGGIASLFSDKNLKEGIKPDKMTAGLDKIRGYAYRYKGNDRPEAGVMAQDLEKGPMAPAVMDTPEGKMIDTRRLSTMNTAALSEHEKRLKDIEKLVGALSGIQGGKK